MCDKQDKLLAHYRATVRAFLMSLDALQAAIAISPRESKEVAHYVEEVRAISENARLKLENHIREHRCHESELVT